MFDFWNNMFKMGRITADNLKEVVEKGFISAEDYQKITGIEYTK